MPAHGIAARNGEGPPRGRVHRWLAGMAMAAAAATTISVAAAGQELEEAPAEDAAQEVARLPQATDAMAEADAADPKDDKAREVAELCRLMISAADAHGVPQGFFIRLIWKESRFNPNAVSPVGAQGIAQFMPGTARLRGLEDPFDREEALFASASFLADLEKQFGSWGLAAAGYNGGPNRVPRFVAGEGGLPAETRDYVFTITGRTAEYWAGQARAARPAEPTDGAEAATGGAAGREASARDASAVGAAPLTALSVLVRRAREEAAGVSAPAGGAAEDEIINAVDVPKPLAEADEMTAAASARDAGWLLAAAATAAVPAPRPPFAQGRVNCADLVDRLARARPIPLPGGTSGGWTPWGAQVAGHPKRSVAMRQYDRLRGRLPADLSARGPTVVVRRFAARGRMPLHAVMFAAGNRAEAQALCKRISAARAPCVVVKNR